jgi:hypothetical protein
MMSSVMVQMNLNGETGHGYLYRKHIAMLFASLEENDYLQGTQRGRQWSYQIFQKHLIYPN